jgi:hypothetical protein
MPVNRMMRFKLKNHDWSLEGVHREKNRALITKYNCSLGYIYVQTAASFDEANI